MNPKQSTESLEFLKHFYILGAFEPAISCVRNQHATIEGGRLW